MIVSSYLQLLRVPQYTKNTFVLLPLFFAGEVTRTDLFVRNLLALVAFCLVASSVYILNDVLDIEEDRKHPSKKARPLASGKVSKKEAGFLMVFLAAAGLCLTILFLPRDVLFLLLAYAGLNVIYSLKLKHLSVVDITVIAIGFVMRLFVGSASTGVPLTVWIITVTFLLALFIGLAKRRDDVNIFENTGHAMRKSVDGYNLEFVNAGMVVLASVIIVSYLMYTVSPEIVIKFKTNKLYLTTIFVVLGILRYMQITFVGQKSGSPTEIVLTDRPLQLAIFFWILSFVAILYFRR
jgi:decaprenyl-phosphate phosphoribosyltransferase